MQLITCPHCGQREEAEFRYGGAASIAYPENPDAIDDAAWAQFLFHRPNPRGEHAERWCHTAGCRRWFSTVRDTVSYRFVRGTPS